MSCMQGWFSEPEISQSWQLQSDQEVVVRRHIDLGIATHLPGILPPIFWLANSF